METNSFWKGAFAPLTKGSGCDHGRTYIAFGEPEEGEIPVYVQFNHTCTGWEPPSNSKVYTFYIDAEGFGDEADGNASDIATDVSEMTESEKLKWLNDQMVSV